MLLQRLATGATGVLISTLSGPSTLGSSHSLPLAHPVLTPYLWLAPRPPVLTPYLWLAPRPPVLTPYIPLAHPSCSSSHSLPLASPSSSSSHFYTVVATSSTPWPPHSSSCKTLLLWTSHSSCGRPNFLAFFCAYFVCCQDASSSGRSLLVQFSGGTYCDKSVQSIHTCHYYWPSGLLCAQRSMPDVSILVYIAAVSHVSTPSGL